MNQNKKAQIVNSYRQKRSYFGFAQGDPHCKVVQEKTK